MNKNMLTCKAIMLFLFGLNWICLGSIPTLAIWALISILTY